MSDLPHLESLSLLRQLDEDNSRAAQAALFQSGEYYIYFSQGNTTYTKLRRLSCSWPFLPTWYAQLAFVAAGSVMAASGGNIEVEEANFLRRNAGVVARLLAEGRPVPAASLDAAHCTVAMVGSQSEFCIVALLQWAQDGPAHFS
jgi:hypothetical protein